MWWGSLSQECCKCISSLLFLQCFLWLWEVAFMGPNSIPRCFCSFHSDFLSFVLMSGSQLWAYRLVLILLLLLKVLVLWQGNLLAIINSSTVSVSPLLPSLPTCRHPSEFNQKYSSVSQDSVVFGLESVATSDSSINQEQDWNCLQV